MLFINLFLAHEYRHNYRRVHGNDADDYLPCSTPSETLAILPSETETATATATVTESVLLSIPLPSQPSVPSVPSGTPSKTPSVSTVTFCNTYIKPRLSSSILDFINSHSGIAHILQQICGSPQSSPTPTSTPSTLLPSVPVDTTLPILSPTPTPSTPSDTTLPILTPTPTPTASVPVDTVSTVLSFIQSDPQICTVIVNACASPTATPSVPSSLSTPSTPSTPSASVLPPETSSVYITFYGYTDNSCQTEAQHNCNLVAYPNIQPYTQENDGSYNNPNTMATAPNWIAPGTKVYVPKIKKYYIMSDDCAECITDYSNGKLRMDLFIGPSTAPLHPNSLINCENTLTGSPYSDSIIINPPSDLEVDPTVLYNDSTQVCY